MVRKFDFAGLSAAEVTASRTQNGANSLPAPKVETFWEKLKDNFNDPLIRILCLALGVTLILAFLGYAQWTEGIGIAVAVALATFVSTYSEFKNESSFRDLQEQASKIRSMVFRDGEVVSLEIVDIVQGDYVLLQEGDKVPADGVLVSGHVEVNQASLTGENNAVPKASTENFSAGAPADFKDPNRCFRGSLVESGEAVLKVEAVGTHTHYGSLARELSDAGDGRAAPLQYKLEKLANSVSTLGYIGAVLIAVSFLFKQIVMDNGYSWEGTTAYLQNWQIALHDIVSALILAIIIVVVAVPEGLPMMIAIVLSLNMRKLLRSQVLVRKLLGIETAGSLDMLFADKTGTITEGVFHPRVFLSGGAVSYNSFREVPRPLAAVLGFALRESTSAVINVTHGREGGGVSIVGGNSSDRAMLKYLDRDALVPAEREAHTVVVEQETLFSSVNKFSAAQVGMPISYASTVFPLSPHSIHQYVFTHDARGRGHKGAAPAADDRVSVTIVKGAAEMILSMCRTHFTEKMEIAPLETGALLNEIDALSREGTRFIAIACAAMPLPAPEAGRSAQLPQDLTLVGILGMMDKIRPEAKDSIRQARGAGIQIVMITGDRRETAESVARSIGLLADLAPYEEERAVISSEQMRELSDREIQDRLPLLRVISRALPTDKSRLVTIAKQGAGRVVGMTGDGVNDAAALRKADVSFAMGSGSELAKEASDIVILNDNIQAILDAALYGRTIFKSIRKFIVFQSTINVASTIIVFLGPFMGFDFPLTLIQLLWVNIVMDTFAALAFGGEPALARYMNEAPIRREAPIVSSRMMNSIMVNGFFIALYSITFLTSDTILSLFSRVVEPAALPPGEMDTARVDTAVELKRQGGPVFLTAFFSFFIFLCTFNAFNVRTARLNICENIAKNTGFATIISVIFLVQILFAYVGGSVLRTVPLTTSEWATLLAMAALVIPWDLGRKVLSRMLLRPVTLKLDSKRSAEE